jgi:hypothetical protein
VVVVIDGYQLAALSPARGVHFMSDNHLGLVPLSTVHAALTRILGRAPRSVTPDDIAAVAGALEWRRTAGWDKEDDVVVATKAGLFEAGFAGATLIVTEASFFRDLGAFLIDGDDLQRFVSEHLIRYGEVFFNGDVVIVEMHGSRIWLFHHEGMYAWRA